MDDARPLFILAGNGPYQNRGCEAIVRGTVNILRQYFTDPRFVCISFFNSEEQFEEQRKNEWDAIEHMSCFRLNKRSAILNLHRPKAWRYVYKSIFDEQKLGREIYSDMLPLLPNARAVLSIGGDNYSLDYGKPVRFTMLDNLVLEQNKPLMIWGASVGPFSKMPEYEEYMGRHLQAVTGIFARESATIDYLRNIGVTENVYPVADPAFLMGPVKPENIENELPIGDEAIGLNLSPLMAKYVTGGDLNAWIKKAASIIDQVVRASEMPVYLIPHVTTPSSDDYGFMHEALSQTSLTDRDVVLVPPKYDAAEMKWIIGRMTVFAGARTHSTIAALSSCIPTLSFAYSLKAQGLNKDLFDNTNYCMGPSDLDAGTVAKRIVSILDDGADVRAHLLNKMPEMRNAALSAGAGLKRLIEVTDV